MWQAKKKKKRKVLSSFWNFFPLSFSTFHLPFYNFPSYLLHFPPFPFFFLPLFSRWVSRNFLVKVSGGHSAPLPPPPPPFTPLACNKCPYSQLKWLKNTRHLIPKYSYLPYILLWYYHKFCIQNLQKTWVDERKKKRTAVQFYHWY